MSQSPNTLNAVKQEIRDLKEWSKDTKKELADIKELRELNKKMDDILIEMEKQVKRDLKDINRATNFLDDALHGIEYKGKYGEDYINDKFDKAKALVEDAAQCEGNIEGLTEQLEHTVKGEINDIKELEQFESKAREVSTEARALSKKIDQVKDQHGY